MLSKFRCTGCRREYDIKDIRYECDCGELLEVIHDLKKFKRTGPDWRKYFDKNIKKIPFYRYKDLLLPTLPDNKIITLNEGNTPLYRPSERLSQFFNINGLYFKHEGLNPTLSFKDRGMVAGVSWANYLGVKIVACASTGDTSASLSAYAANSKNLKAVVLLPKGKISFEQLSQPISFGAKTLGLDTDFDGCMRLVRELSKKHPVYLLNSMNSIRIEGQKAIGIETLHQLNWNVPDWFVIPIGNAGNISALCKGLRELYELNIINKLPRVAGVQVEAACPLYNSYKKDFSDFRPVKAKKTVASAIRIGSPVSFKKAVRELKFFKGVVEKVSDKEVMDSKALVESTGISLCPNSATAVAGMRKLRKANVIKKNDSVVVILTAHGSKFSQSTIKYHKNKKSEYGNSPVYLKADLKTIENELGLK